LRRVECIGAQYKMNVADVRKLSSHDLVNLLAQHGYGMPIQEGDTRSAHIAEWGTFTASGRSFVKIVVRVDTDTVFDYGARLFFE